MSEDYDPDEEREEHVGLREQGKGGDDAEVYESFGDAPVDEPPPDKGDAGAEGIEGDGGA